MDEPLEEVYFKWLCAKVELVDVPTPSLTHWKLLRELHATEFVWLVSGDDNRAEDGIDIRKEFFNQARIPRDSVFMGEGCSVLEMLIAFSRRTEFQTDVSAHDWFWIFIINLGLDSLNDAAIGIHRKAVEILDRFIWRTYSRNGYGGLFPLEHAEQDQRKVETWYQFCEWVVEHEIE